MIKKDGVLHPFCCSIQFLSMIFSLLVYLRKGEDFSTVKYVLFLIFIGFSIRTLLLIVLLSKLNENPVKAFIPFYGDALFLNYCTKRKFTVCYLVFGFLSILGVCCSVMFGAQMKIIMTQGLEAYSRLHGDVLPYHLMYYIATGIAVICLIILALLRLKICKDIQLSFGRTPGEKLLFLLVPPIGYVKMVSGNYKYYGNPYEEGFVDFASFA